VRSFMHPETNKALCSLARDLGQTPPILIQSNRPQILVGHKSKGFIFPEAISVVFPKFYHK
jgi:hypothetical protein